MISIMFFISVLSIGRHIFKNIGAILGFFTLLSFLKCLLTVCGYKKLAISKH